MRGGSNPPSDTHRRGAPRQTVALVTADRLIEVPRPLQLRRSYLKANHQMLTLESLSR